MVRLGRQPDFLQFRGSIRKYTEAFLDCGGRIGSNRGVKKTAGGHTQEAARVCSPPPCGLRLRLHVFAHPPTYALFFRTIAAVVELVSRTFL